MAAVRQSHFPDNGRSHFTAPGAGHSPAGPPRVPASAAAGPSHHRRRLDDGEKYLADGGYNDGGQYSETPNGLNNPDQRRKATARARHETAYSRFKEFCILAQTYRHTLHRHGTVFKAVANIVQWAIILERPLFDVEYNDRPV